MSKFLDVNFPAIFSEAFGSLRDFDKKLISAIGEQSLNLKAILDRGISFDDNVDSRRVSVTSHATPGTEFSVTHTLGKIPKGRIVYGQDKAGSLYAGSTTNTTTTMYFKSDASSATFDIIVF